MTTLCTETTFAQMMTFDTSAVYFYSAEEGSIIKVDLEQTDSNNPIDPINRICSNADGEYKNAKYRVNIEPDTRLANLSISGTASVKFADGTTSKNNVANGTVVTLTATDDTTGTWKLKAESADVSGCTDEAEEEVFKVVLKKGDIDSTGGKTGEANYGDYYVNHYAGYWIPMGGGGTEGGDLDKQHAAKMDLKRYAWFETEPSGKYSSYVKAKLKVVEEFTDGSTTGYGVKIYNDGPRSGDLNVSLTYGPLTVSMPPMTGENDYSGWNGLVKIKGPNDTSWSESPAGSTEAKTSDLGALEWTSKKSISTSSEQESPLNHYKVGDSSSRAETHSEFATSGACAVGDKELHASWGDAKVTTLCDVEISGSLELTSSTSP